MCVIYKKGENRTNSIDKSSKMSAARIANYKYSLFIIIKFNIFEGRERILA